MSIDNVTPEEWNRASKTAVGKLYHPQDKYKVTQPDHYNKGAIEAIEVRRPCTHRRYSISRATA